MGSSTIVLLLCCIFDYAETTHLILRGGVLRRGGDRLRGDGERRRGDGRRRLGDGERRRLNGEGVRRLVSRRCF